MPKSEGNVLDPLAIIEGRTVEQIKEMVGSSGYPELLAATQNKLSSKSMIEIRRTKGVKESGADSLRLALVDYLRQTRQISFDVANVDIFRKLGFKLFNLFKVLQPSSGF